MNGPYTAKHLVIVAAITVALIGGVMAYRAVRYEETGVAVYWGGSDDAQRKEVRRDLSSADFRDVVRSTWQVSIGCFVIAGLGLALSWKLAASEYDS